MRQIRDVNIIAPEIGETVPLDSDSAQHMPPASWWDMPTEI